MARSSSILTKFASTLILGSMILFLGPRTSAQVKFQLSVETSKPGPKIHRNIFGQFAEHLGGCFADEYHWRKGIGSRAVTLNPNWGWSCRAKHLWHARSRTNQNSRRSTRRSRCIRFSSAQVRQRQTSTVPGRLRATRLLDRC